jgi:outer membrane protein OmpA-like peptidoglycan-associated protein
MKLFDATRKMGLLGASVLVVTVAVGCGGVIQFSDQSALAIKGTPPAPPPPPPQEEKRVVVRDDRIEINEKIQFAYNDSKILAASDSLLTEIAAVFKDTPRIKQVEIGGHASSEGSDSHNLDLSDRRAKAVQKWLIDKGGVAADRLKAKGYGETKPLVSPDETEADREKNRRVEFLILDQDITQKKIEIDPKTGEEKVVEEKKLKGGS